MKLIVTSILVAALIFGGLILLLRHAEHSPLHAKILSPGPLSKAHASLEKNCLNCHTPNHGIEAKSCIVCHANASSLLAKQSTQFHETIGSCKECHAEHRGRDTRPVGMGHDALVRIAERENDTVSFVRFIKNFNERRTAEVALNCVSCHSKEDKHQSLFGQNCAACHSTDHWSIAKFLHPSPASRECAQCHQAPPSHYMMHFEMVSMKVAEIEHADVRQCYLCHQTSSWNDIKGIGWYKHH